MREETLLLCTFPWRIWCRRKLQKTYWYGSWGEETLWTWTLPWKIWWRRKLQQAYWIIGSLVHEGKKPYSIWILCLGDYVAPHVTPVPSLHIWITQWFSPWEKKICIINTHFVNYLHHQNFSSVEEKKPYHNKKLSYLYLKRFIVDFLSIKIKLIFFRFIV